MNSSYGLNEYSRINLKKTKKQGFISVIIPVYKDPAGLNKTLNSLQKQSIDKESYEIIVANDGADQEIAKVCNEFKVKYVDIAPNMGSYFARNSALEISSGEYIAFVDADIIVPENWLENGIKALQRWDYAAGDVIIDENKIDTVTHFYDSEYTFQVKRFLEVAHFGPTANLFVKRSVFEYTGGFDIRLKSGGDAEFGNRIFEDTKFFQGYMGNNAVKHPPRGYAAYIKKMYRVVRGQRDLLFLYPSRFEYIKKPFFLILKEIVTPSKRAFELYTKESNQYHFLRLFFFCWWIKIIEYCLKLRYLFFINRHIVKFERNHSVIYHWR